MSIDAMKQAVEALEYAEFYIKSAAEFGYSNRAVAKHIFSEAIADLRAAIEQSEQRWVKSYAGGKPNYTTPEEPGVKWDASSPLVVQPHPAFKKWQGLTDEEIAEVRHLYDGTAGWTIERFARQIEAKLKEKNHG